mmetsp:Transcript_17241/g.31238  ORF Transcript_17241/g.31238 Transcript_17241/m.31238 type:complete len:585 (-) Transcript_17241:850-2604(-)
MKSNEEVALEDALSMRTMCKIQQKVVRCCVWIVIVVIIVAASASASAPATRDATREVSMHRMNTFDISRGGDEKNTSLASMNNTTYPNKESETIRIMPAPTTSTDKKKARFFLFRIFRRRMKQPGRQGGEKVQKRVKKHTVAFTNKMNEKLEEARRMFLDRMAAVSFELIDQEHDATTKNDTFFHLDGDDDAITPQSDLCLPNRSIYVVTTAALPWRTGTAVNPLLRAAYLSRRAKEINNQKIVDEYISEEEIDGSNATDLDRAPIRQMVTLVIPWLELEEDRLEIYGPDRMFSSNQEQEKYIREWLRNDAHMVDAADSESGLRIIFYPARYHSGLNSIFAMGDIISVLRNQTDGDDLADAVCILEEPEHLNWYRAPGTGWTKVFNYVVGIVHTNYIEYAGTQFHGLWTAPAIQVMSSAMIRAYCHKVIKLSGVLQSYAPEKESIKNVHGVREDFIREGKRRGLCSLNMTDFPLDEEVEGQVYYIGKILWAKGFDKMLELEEFYHECTGKYFAVDIYGGGPEEDEIKRAFHGKRSRKKTQTEETQSLSREYVAKKLQSIKMSSQEFHIPKTLYEWRESLELFAW